MFEKRNSTLIKKNLKATSDNLSTYLYNKSLKPVWCYSINFTINYFVRSEWFRNWISLGFLLVARPSVSHFKFFFLIWWKNAQLSSVQYRSLRWLYFSFLGGWTAIHMNSLSESNLHFESTSYDITHYRNLSNYNDRRQYLVPSVLVSLQNDMGFDQIRYYCHKKQSGTVFHIMTSMNPFGEAVVKYFLDASLGAVRPEACASYTVLPDDNSTLSSDCSMLGWNGTHADGKWTHYGDNNRNRVMSPMKIFGKRSFASRVKKLSCDDNKGTKKSSLSPGDRWAIFVRWKYNVIIDVVIVAQVNADKKKKNSVASISKSGGSSISNGNNEKRNSDSSSSSSVVVV